MREIKFRAWNESRKEYQYSERYGHLSTFFMLNEQVAEIEQSTGLCDKTTWGMLSEEERYDWTRSGFMPSEWIGREIYEGDIVKVCTLWSSSIGNSYENRLVVWIDSIAGFNHMGIKEAGPFIIGNIHENKDLLNA